MADGVLLASAAALYLYNLTDNDGRVFAGGTAYGRPCARPSANWRTTAADLDLFVEVVRELGATAADQVVAR